MNQDRDKLMTSFQKYTVVIGQVSTRWRPRIAHSHTHNCDKRQSAGGWVAKWLNPAEPLNKLLHWIYVIDLDFDLSVTPIMFEINVYIKILSFPNGLLLFYNGIEYFVCCNFKPARFGVGNKKLNSPPVVSLYLVSKFPVITRMFSWLILKI